MYIAPITITDEDTTRLIESGEFDEFWAALAVVVRRLAFVRTAAPVEPGGE